MKLVLGSDFPNVPPKGGNVSTADSAAAHLFGSSVHSLIAASGQEAQRASCRVQGRL